MKVMLICHNSLVGNIRDVAHCLQYRGGHPAGFVESNLPPVIAVDWGCAGAKLSLFALDQNELYQRDGEEIPVYREVPWIIISSHR